MLINFIFPRSKNHLPSLRKRKNEKQPVILWLKLWKRAVLFSAQHLASLERVSGKSGNGGANTDMKQLWIKFDVFENLITHTTVKKSVQKIYQKKLSKNYVKKICQKIWQKIFQKKKSVKKSVKKSFKRNLSKFMNLLKFFSDYTLF